MTGSKRVSQAVVGSQLQERPVCDACDREFDVGDRAVLYVTDVFLKPDGVERQDGLQACSLFCASGECSRGVIEVLPLPHVSATEGLVEVVIDAGWVVGSDVEVLDWSARGEGVPWSVACALEAFAGMPYSEFSMISEDDSPTMGYQDVLVWMWAFGVNPADFVTANGSFDVDQETLNRLRIDVLEGSVERFIGLTGVGLSVERLQKVSEEMLEESGETQYATW